MIHSFFQFICIAILSYETPNDICSQCGVVKQSTVHPSFVVLILHQVARAVDTASYAQNNAPMCAPSEHDCEPFTSVKVT